LLCIISIWSVQRFLEKRLTDDTDIATRRSLQVKCSCGTLCGCATFALCGIKCAPTRAFVCNIYCMCLAMKAQTYASCQLPVASRQALQCLFICVYSTLNCAIKARLLLFQLCESHWIHSTRNSELRTRVSGTRGPQSDVCACW